MNKTEARQTLIELLIENGCVDSAETMTNEQLANKAFTIVDETDANFEAIAKLCPFQTEVYHCNHIGNYYRLSNIECGWEIVFYETKEKATEFANSYYVEEGEVAEVREWNGLYFNSILFNMGKGFSDEDYDEAAEQTALHFPANITAKLYETCLDVCSNGNIVCIMHSSYCETEDYDTNINDALYEVSEGIGRHLTQFEKEQLRSAISEWTIEHSQKED